MKFTPRITPSLAQKSNKNISKPTPVSIERVSPPPPLPAKTAKEVNFILKYFQNKKPLNNTNKIALKNNKLYAQVSKASANTSEVLKISKAFLALNAEKINQINNIVKEVAKPKPKIQMITKGPSRKQVITLMSKENIDSFMKNSSLHVANINQQFRNAKSEILVDYICAEPLGITIVTNKVSQQSDLMIIDHYIKNSNNVNSFQVKEPQLPKSKSYLKIIGIPYYPYDNSQEHLLSNDIELVLK